jgi:uncharacterized protein
VFEWDEKKALGNLEKHGVTFNEAATCFIDDHVVVNEDPSHSTQEQRLIAIAKSALDRILVVVFTVRRNTDGQESYRIISARQASKKERKIYAR